VFIGRQTVAGPAGSASDREVQTVHRWNPLYWLGSFRKPRGFRPQDWMIVQFLRRILMPPLRRLATFRVVVTGGGNVPKYGGVIVAGNHPSVWDPVAVFGALDRNVAFIAKAELWRKRPLGAFLDRLGQIPVVRGNRDSGAEVQATALRVLTHGDKRSRNRGGVVAMFPEGGLTPRETGEMKPFKKGVYYMARESGRPVVPCGIVGTEQIRVRGFRKLWKRHQRINVHVRFGIPMFARDYAGTLAEALFLTDLRDQIMELSAPATGGVNTAA
jgi:1-acyl-sn-glycerol-3-phosphate acyltransferase